MKNNDNSDNKGRYIAFHWQYNNKKPPLIRFVVVGKPASESQGQFSIEISNQKFSNQKFEYKFVANKNKEPIVFTAPINEKDSINFLNVFLSVTSIHLNNDVTGLSKPLYMKEFTDFYNQQQENAKFLYGDKIPTLPRLDARSFSLQSQLKQADPSISNCQSQNMPVLNIQFNDQQAFIANCEDIASNDNAYYRLQKQTANTILDAQFDGKAHLLGQNWLFDPVANKNTLELHSRQIFSPNNDCGRDYGFAYNGKVWQLSFFTAMPFCELIQQEDWPVLYQSQIAQ